MYDIFLGYTAESPPPYISQFVHAATHGKHKVIYLATLYTRHTLYTRTLQIFNHDDCVYEVRTSHNMFNIFISD